MRAIFSKLYRWLFPSYVELVLQARAEIGDKLTKAVVQEHMRCTNLDTRYWKHNGQMYQCRHPLCEDYFKAMHGQPVLANPDMDTLAPQVNKPEEKLEQHRDEGIRLGHTHRTDV